MFGSTHRVVQQGGDGHDADAPGNWCDGSRNLDRAGQVDVTDKPFVGSIDSDVDNDRARLQMGSINEIGAPNGGDNDVCLPGQVLEIPGS